MPYNQNKYIWSCISKEKVFTHEKDTIQDLWKTRF
jgi:hypothetical protein